jgi:putative ABC transport system substrate-binding protein
MQRRAFLGYLGGMAGWPLAARAQQANLPIIGFLASGTSTTQRQRIAAFAKRLNELGWIEGSTVAIEYRWAEGRSERFAEFADEFVRKRVAVIVTNGSAPVLAAKRKTSTIPIVSTVMGDPVGTGLVVSLARPGGNITGLSLQQPDLAGKRLELLREVAPGFRRLAVMANIGNPVAALEMREVEASARRFGLELARLELRRTSDIAPAIEKLTERAEALYVVGDPLITTNRARVVALVLGTRLPVIYNSREYAEAGGLMAYGPNYLELYRRAGDHVDKILRGTKPGDIPVEQPTKFELIVNLKTAKALGLEIPPKFLFTADEVIE